MTDIINLSSRELRHIANLKEKIDSLQDELAQIVDGAAPAPQKKSGMSAAGRARIAAAQRARWAKFHSSGKSEKNGARPKRKFSAAARAKIAAAARARWAKAKAAGKKTL